MSHLFYLQMTRTVVLLVFGFMLWAATLTNSPSTDTVTMYALNTDAPSYSALTDEAARAPVGSSAPAISLGAWYSINETCMDPDTVQKLLLTDPTFMTDVNFPNLPVSPGNPGTMGMIYNKKGLLTSPLCRCLVIVLTKFNTMGVATPIADRVASANKAYQACFSTNTHTPRQKQWLEVNYNTQKINTRKTTSKVSFALIICLSLLFGVIYNSLDYTNPANFYSNGYNRTRLGSLIFIAILQMLLPIAFNTYSHPSSIIALTALVIIPALIIQFISMEFAWSYLHADNRAIHMHPYVFVTTLISLIAISLFESGVFDIGIFFYYIFIAHALSVAYAATLFFAHFNKPNSDDTHTLSGYIVLFVAAALLVISGMTPSHPTNCEYSAITLLPWLFSAFVFCFSIFIEHTHQSLTDKENILKGIVPHMYFEGHAFVVAMVLGYFMLKLWHVSLGDTTLSNAGGMLPRYNFAFFEDMNSKIPSLYSVP